MLEECKEAYRREANLIPGWENLSKNDLCYGYIEHSDNPVLQSAYFGALMCKYWPLIPKYYYMCSNVASFDDCYNWLIDSISYALKHRRWEDPDSSIYQDPNGPDKVINRYMKCARLTFYQFINRKKRKDNFGMLSLDELLNVSESSTDSEDYSFSEDNSRIDLDEFIKQQYLKKDYFLAFMLYFILTEDVFDYIDGKAVFNVKKLAKHIRHINEETGILFAETYNLIPDEVNTVIKNYCTNLSSNLIYSKIEYNLLKIKHILYKAI